MEYTIKLPALEFEGPFDLLFHLIEKDKIDLNDIPLAKITNDYLEMIQLMQELDIRVAGEFLVMAASLLRLKSQSLLPRGNEYDRFLYPHMANEPDLDIPEMDEETPFFDSQEDMVNKLKEYKVYKDMAHKLRECESFSGKVYYKTVKIETKPTLMADDLKMENLLTAFQKVLKNIKDKKVQRILVEKISVEDKIEKILRRLEEISAMSSFEELLETGGNRYEIVMTFLAVLELSKLQKITIGQDSNFSEITIKKSEINGIMAA